MEAKSYLHRVANKPLLYATLPELMERRAAETTDKVAYVLRRPDAGRDVITFRGLRDRSRRVAARFAALGVGPGDRVIMIGPGCSEWFYAEFGILTLQAVTLILPGEVDTGESLRNILNDFKCKAVIYHPGAEDAVFHRLAESFPNHVGPKDGIQPAECDGLKSTPIFMPLIAPKGCDVTSVASLAEVETTPEENSRLDGLSRTLCPDDLAIIFMTSGSTGTPKSVALSHFNIVDFYKNIVEFLDISEEDPYFSDRSLAWIVGMFGLAVVSKATFVFVDPAFVNHATQREYLYKVMEEEKVTRATFLSYWFYDVVADTAAGRACLPSSLQRALTAGEQPNIELAAKMSKLFPNITNIYGCTEGGWLLLENLAAQVVPGNESIFSRLLPGAEAKVSDDEGLCVPRNTVGELWIRAPGMFRGYLNPASGHPDFGKTEAGWFKTGDMARMLPDDRIHLLGRKVEIISRGAKKVFPSVLERLITSWDKVRQCVVVGVPDARMFEEVCACVVPAAGQSVSLDDLVEFVEQKILVSTEFGFTPRYLWVLDFMPLNRAGKVDRSGIRQQARERFRSDGTTH